MTTEIRVGSQVQLRHGRAVLTGEVVSITEDGRKAEVLVKRDGEEPITFTRNLSFLELAPEPAGGS